LAAKNKTGQNPTFFVFSVQIIIQMNMTSHGSDIHSSIFVIGNSQSFNEFGGTTKCGASTMAELAVLTEELV